MSSEFKRLFSKGPPKNPKINVKATGEKEFVDCFIQTYRSSSSICPLNLVPDKENNSKKKKKKSTTLISRRQLFIGKLLVLKYNAIS